MKLRRRAARPTDCFGRVDGFTRNIYAPLVARIMSCVKKERSEMWRNRCVLAGIAMLFGLGTAAAQQQTIPPGQQPPQMRGRARQPVEQAAAQNEGAHDKQAQRPPAPEEKVCCHTSLRARRRASHQLHRDSRDVQHQGRRWDREGDDVLCGLYEGRSRRSRQAPRQFCLQRWAGLGLAVYAHGHGAGTRGADRGWPRNACAVYDHGQ